MPENSATPVGRRLTGVEWAICAVAAIGFAFDTYELLMLPLIVQDALRELGGIKPGTPQFTMWFDLLLFVPAVCGGIFGLLGGYLTDWLGRRRVLTWSILLYACSAFAAGFSTSLWMLLVLRCTTFIGVCVEFVAAVAWLAELFDDPLQRERMLGYTQAISSVGGLLVAIAYGALARNAAHLPALGTAWAPFLGTIAEPHAPWRYTLFSGLIPALPLIVIRPWLPESPKWRAQKKAGLLRRPSFSELFSPRLLRTTVVTTVMVACSYGAAFGAIQMLRQIVPRMPEVQAEAHGKPVPVQKRVVAVAASDYAKVQEIGGLVGRFVLALLVIRIVSRKNLLRVFLLPGMVAMPLIFLAFARVAHNPVWFSINLSWIFLEPIPITPMHLAIAVAGFFTVAQFSFWGNYLPRVYPTHLRGTGESFAANVGGRMIGTSMAAVTPFLAGLFASPGDNAAASAAKIAYAAAIVGFTMYAGGFLASFFLPEPAGDKLPE